jgi:hypothetical protein
MHTILDLDLDVFSYPTVHWPQTNARPADSDHGVATSEDVRFFLEQQCSLNPADKVPGQEFTDHDEAFFVWRRWIREGRISPPFDVIHVDAHADMGLGDSGYMYLLSELLALPPDKRDDPRRGYDAMNAGNYLMFAVANRWINNLTYVFPWQRPWSCNWQSGLGETIQPDSGDGAPGDLMVMHFRNGDWKTRQIELRHCTIEALNASLGRAVLQPVISTEPPVPFDFTRIRDFHTTKITHFVVAQSPQFAPSAADALLPIIRNYFVSDEERSPAQKSTMRETAR